MVAWPFTVPHVNIFKRIMSIMHCLSNQIKRFSDLCSLKSTLKVGLSPPKKFVLFDSFESPLKMINNAFYFI